MSSFTHIEESLEHKIGDIVFFKYGQAIVMARIQRAEYIAGVRNPDWRYFVEGYGRAFMVNDLATSPRYLS